ncbi:MAG: copper chaperone PCu(A)C [Gemmatimonadales bacterium]
MRSQLKALRLTGLVLVLAVIAGCHPSRGGSAASGTIRISHAVVPASPSPTDASGFMVIDNQGTTADSLIGVSSPDAEMVMLHQTTEQGMDMVDGVAIPAGGRVPLAPGGYHLMLQGLTHQAAVGDTITVRLVFSKAGDVVVRAPVLRYTEAVEEVPSH